METREPNSGVQLAIEVAGTQEALAELCGVRQPSVYHWLYRSCPPVRAVQLENVTGVPRELIRPDLFTDGELVDG